VTSYDIIAVEPWGSATGENLFSNNRFLKENGYSQSLENRKRYGTL
jgi:hypothetical protein